MNNHLKNLEFGCEIFAGQLKFGTPFLVVTLGSVQQMLFVYCAFVFVPRSARALYDCNAEDILELSFQRDEILFDGKFTEDAGLQN